MSPGAAPVDARSPGSSAGQAHVAADGSSSGGAVAAISRGVGSWSFSRGAATTPVPLEQANESSDSIARPPSAVRMTSAWLAVGMALLVQNVPWTDDADEGAVVAERLRVRPAEVTTTKLVRKSLDARHRKQRWTAVFRV